MSEILPDNCIHCGEEYDRFRTGYSFSDIKAMLWVDSDNPTDWKHKRRNTVLGFWREIKLGMWKEHLFLCDKNESHIEKCDSIIQAEERLNEGDY
jgi:hypothetical protein